MKKLSYTLSAMKFLTLFLIVFHAIVVVASDIDAAKVVYGDDNRQDLFEVANPMVLRLSKATAALFPSGVVAPMTNGDYFIQTTQYGENFNLCSDERFFKQRVAAFCSAFLVAPDVMATAGHCIASDEACAKTTVVFNYAYDYPDRRVDHADKEHVFRCKKLLHRQYTKSAIDFALIKLDRPVKGITPLKVRRAEKIDEAEFVVMGYPMGLPLKITDQAYLRKNELKKGFFTINSDTYQGNSGSAVVNANTGIVEGILVRGAKDLVKNRELKCNQTNYCKEDGCRGEDVTAAFTFAGLL